ncbi:defensin-A-like [Sabethes cyaneus]|uniref:defensin-A-like n=1 Tax=Sabethes cyaneus TaxID=53552 RepID=UPI00237DEA82|nr:defensin-A-like [Sabethes cyaneus]
MRSTVIFGFALLCLLVVGLPSGSGMPQDGVLTQETHDFLQDFVDSVDVVDGDENVPLTDEHYRAKRATCDLLSGFGVADSACAAHCILRRNRGGYCNKRRVCVCRN